jgi:hypothetical protein
MADPRPDWVMPDPALVVATAAIVDMVGEWWERKRRREKKREWERREKKRKFWVVTGEDECISVKMNQRRRVSGREGEDKIQYFCSYSIRCY